MIKVLCIEDDPQMIDLIEMVFAERTGYEVTGAQGGRQALEILQHEKPDLILLDLMMPEMDGGDVFHHIKEQVELRNIPVVVVTAKAAPVDKILWINVARVDGYVIKPFGPNELLDEVERVLTRFGYSV